MIHKKRTASVLSSAAAELSVKIQISPTYLPSADSAITAMYGTNFNSKFFTDITMPVIKYGIGYIGKLYFL